MDSKAWCVLGSLLIVVVAYDIYTTILHARGRNGPISEFLIRLIWRTARAVAFRAPRQARHRLLNSLGPALLPLLIILYLFLLTTGYALIYYPYIETNFIVAQSAVSSPWSQAFYFSGVSLLTVGYGDVVPATRGFRLLALSEAAAGLGVISLAVTYLLTVYGALERKRTVALSFYHQAAQGADVAGLIAHYFVRGTFSGFDSALRNASRDIHNLFESHIEHPIIHYFHPQEVYKSLPRVLFLQLELCSIMRSCLDADRNDSIYDHPELRTLDGSARALLEQLVACLDLGGIGNSQVAETRIEERRRWKSRFRATIKRLQAAGVPTRTDLARGEQLYGEKRLEWERDLYLLSSFLGYEWDEITGDRDLRYAADEEMEEAADTDLKVASAATSEKV